MMNIIANWISYIFPQPLRHVGMFETAKPNCYVCRGTGWYANYTDKCMSSCNCVDHKETVFGNE